MNKSHFSREIRLHKRCKTANLSRVSSRAQVPGSGCDTDSPKSRLNIVSTATAAPDTMEIRDRTKPLFRRLSQSCDHFGGRRVVCARRCEFYTQRLVRSSSSFRPILPRPVISRRSLEWTAHSSRLKSPAESQAGQLPHNTGDELGLVGGLGGRRFDCELSVTFYCPSRAKLP